MESVVQWKGIENWHEKPYSVEELLWSSDKKMMAQEWGLEGLTTMLHVRHKWKHSLIGKCSLFSVFTLQKWFPPGMGKRFQAWRDNQKNRLNDVFLKVKKWIRVT